MQVAHAPVPALGIDTEQLKEHFYPRKKSLGGQDLIELSGYLLEKLYGYINPADEYLRASIEDVRELLERAATAAPDVPESRYNMGLYFVHTNNTNAAKDWLAAAVESFKTAATQSRNRLLRYINTYRLLGELYSHDDEFLSAEQYYRTGIELYESAVAAGFTGNNIVGQLYADLADLNYFVIGDMDVALKNYLAAIPLDNDTASIRYRVGYIQYAHNQYMEALGSFIKAVDYNPTDTHILLALGNVLSIRGDNFAAQGGTYRYCGFVFKSIQQSWSNIVPPCPSDRRQFVECRSFSKLVYVNPCMGCDDP